jgi:redox-regulated HSP33 family molecular chaperone
VKVTDAFVSEPSSENETFIVRALCHTAYDGGIVYEPSEFICECDSKRIADYIAKILNEHIEEFIF